jgi:hypothetical protein
MAGAAQGRATFIRAALAYLAIVLGTGFVLGMVRVPFLVPRLGERWAELLEMPVMAAVIFLAAGLVLRRFPAMRSPRRTWFVGLLGLGLMVASELALAIALQDRTLAEYIGSRDPVSGAVYLGLLLVFAPMPRLCLSAHAPCDSPAR